MSTATETAPEKKRLKINFNLRQYGILGALVIIVVLFEILTGGRLLMAGNVNNLIQQNAYVLILAIGMVMIIIAGHIDLSVGSVVAMVGAICAISMEYWHFPWWGAVLLGLITGAVVGAWQGFWVAYVGIPAFIVTLAGMLLFRGLTLVLLTAGTINGLPDGFVKIGAGWLPDWMGGIAYRDTLTMFLALVAVVCFVVQQLRSRRSRKNLGLPLEASVSFWGKNVVAAAAVLALGWLLAGYHGTPIILIVLAVLIVAYSVVLNRSVFGRRMYAIGGNRFAAQMSGVDTRKIDFMLFVNMGLLASVAAVASTARAGGAVAAAGQNYELDAIAAAFIGGAAVQGGVGTVVGAVIGGLVMGVLNMGLSILAVDAAWQMAIKGLVLLLAVAFDIWNKARSGR
jgi:putative multiple sugar transport system permease protein